MIKLGLVKKFGIELVSGDMVTSSDKSGSAAMISRTASTYFNGVGTEDYRRVESFAPRLISDGIPTSIGGDVLLEITNGNGLVLYISARNVAWHAWTTWRPSMEWLVQQSADKPVTYKDDTQQFWEDVQVDLHNVTYVPEGFVRSSAPESAKPIFTQAMADAGELPPVGSECDICYENNGLFFKGSVIAYFEDLLWLDLGDKNPVRMTREVKFKPLDTRTEKQKEVDLALAEWPMADKPTLEFAYDYWLSGRKQ